jgi:hypothetical protein
MYSQNPNRASFLPNTKFIFPNSSMWSVLPMRPRVECWHCSTSCPKYYVLCTTSGIARCSQLSSSCQVRQHGLPFPAYIMVKIAPTGPLSIYSLTGVMYSDAMGPSFAEYNNVPSNTFVLASKSWHMSEIESGT